MLITDLTVDQDPTADRIAVNLCDEAQRRRGRHRRFRMRPRQRRQRDFDRLAVQVRVGDFPATAKASKYLIGDVLGIDLNNGGGNSASSGRIGDRLIQVSNRVYPLTDDRDNNEEDSGQP